MSIPDIPRRDSNISLTSSWTLINDSTISGSGSQEFFNIESDSDIDKQEEPDLHKNSICSLLSEQSLHETNKDNEEYNPELNKSKRKKKKKLQQRKNEVEVLSLLSIAACILTITGITLLTNIISENIHNESITKIHESYLDTVTATSPDTNLSKLFNKTHEVIKLADDIDLFSVIDKFVMDSTNFEDETCTMFDNVLNVSYSEQLGPANYDTQLASSNTSFIRRALEKSREFLGTTASMLLKSPGFQIILATILQDICLIKLVRDLSNNKNNKVPTTYSQLDQQIPKKTQQKKHKKKLGKRLKHNTNTKQLLDTTIINQINARYNNQDKSTAENGKSECERRFEELDTEWKIIGHNHRQKIQEIKDTFQKEIVQIKQNEMETNNRRKRITLTREKYIQRLQIDRENFLHKLKKVREERQNLLDQICQQKLKNRTGSSKDASVGNYAVLLPGSYDFQKKLQMLKDKESQPVMFDFAFKKKDETKQQENNDSLTKKEKTLKNKQKLKEAAKKLSMNPKKYSEVTKKYFKKHAKLLRKHDKFVKPDVSLQNKMSNNTEIVVYNPKNDTSKNVDKIYKAAFDKKGEKIQKLDMLRWNKARKLQRKNEGVYKQNRISKRGNKEKMTFKGPL